MVAINDGGSFFWNIVWVHKSDIPEKEIAGVPSKQVDSRVDQRHIMI